MVRIALVDDDALVRAGLSLILGGTKDLEVVAQAEDGDQVEAMVAEHRPDLVLMDIRMPRVDGLEATETLLKAENPPKVVMLTTFDADDMVLKALAVGASGVLLKDTPPERMIESIRQVAAGEQTLSPSIVSQVIAVATQGVGDPRRDAARADVECLTNREREVALAIGHGLTNADIARTQFMSVATVKSHVTRILEKLGMTNRVQIAIRVHDAGLDQDDN